jgi:hypothetical protein
MINHVLPDNHHYVSLSLSLYLSLSLSLSIAISESESDIFEYDSPLTSINKGNSN